MYVTYGSYFNVLGITKRGELNLCSCIFRFGKIPENLSVVSL